MHPSPSVIKIVVSIIEFRTSSVYLLVEVFNKEEISRITSGQHIYFRSFELLPLVLFPLKYDTRISGKKILGSMSSCGNSACSCGSNCSCGNNCKCRKRAFYGNILIDTMSGMENMSDGVTSTVEFEFEGDCKCGANCNCATCTCHR